MRMLVSRSWSIFVVAVLLASAAKIYASAKKEWVTLYYVDAPETNLKQAERTREQSIHFGITLDDTLKAGTKAKERVRELLQKSFLIRTRWATAGGRGRESRYYVIVEIDKKNLGEILINEDLARTKGVAPNLPTGERAGAYMQRLEGLEADARQKRIGAWSTSATKVETNSR